MPDEKFESGSFSSFGDMTSQNSLWRGERVIKFGYLHPENGFNFAKMSLYVQIRSFRPKMASPMSILAIVKLRMRKEQQQPPD